MSSTQKFPTHHKYLDTGSQSFDPRSQFYGEYSNFWFSRKRLTNHFLLNNNFTLRYFDQMKNSPWTREYFGTFGSEHVSVGTNLFFLNEINKKFRTSSFFFAKYSNTLQRDRSKLGVKGGVEVEAIKQGFNLGIQLSDKDFKGPYIKAKAGINDRPICAGGVVEMSMDNLKRFNLYASTSYDDFHLIGDFSYKKNLEQRGRINRDFKVKAGYFGQYAYSVLGVQYSFDRQAYRLSDLAMGVVGNGFEARMDLIGKQIFGVNFKGGENFSLGMGYLRGAGYPLRCAFNFQYS